jgi:hypothetical protein
MFSHAQYDDGPKTEHLSNKKDVLGEGIHIPHRMADMHFSA